MKAWILLAWQALRWAVRKAAGSDLVWDCIERLVLAADATGMRGAVKKYLVEAVLGEAPVQILPLPQYLPAEAMPDAETLAAIQKVNGWLLDCARAVIVARLRTMKGMAP